ncbi:hypothetical protein AHF37_11039 [Paragonimus kellicotti]|nr:hypothetical protein AHF37_11039 [Paragonimus kellicotti]
MRSTLERRPMLFLGFSERAYKDGCGSLSVDCPSMVEKVAVSAGDLHCLSAKPNVTKIAGPVDIHRTSPRLLADALTAALASLHNNLLYEAKLPAG